MSVKLAIVKVERGTTKKALENRMWRCFTDDEQQVNIFENHLPLVHKAGYGKHFEAMEDKDVLYWISSPIQMTAEENGPWLNLANVAVCTTSADPDPEPEFVPSPMWIEYMKRWTQTEDVVVWDSETTGLKNDDEIISVGAVYLDTGESVFPSENVFICPSDPQKAAAAQDVHGITPEFIADKPTFPEVYDELRAALHDKVWIIYNVPFDWNRLNRDCERHGLPYIMPIVAIDAMEVYGRYSMGQGSELARSWPKVKLTVASETMNVVVENAHNAYADSIMTRLVLQAIANQG